MAFWESINRVARMLGDAGLREQRGDKSGSEMIDHWVQATKRRRSKVEVGALKVRSRSHGCRA